MNRILTAVLLLASSCECGFQAVEECPGQRCGADGGADAGRGGGTGGGLGGGTGGALGGGTGGALGGGTGGALGGGTGGAFGGGTGGALGGGTGGGALGGEVGGGGGASSFDGGTWTCQLPLTMNMGPWCTDATFAQLHCSDAALIGEGRSLSVAVDRDRVAWTVIDDRANGTVWVATRDGGTPSCVAPYSYPPLPGGAVSLRNGFIYWSDFSVAQQRGFVMRAPLDGGAAEVFDDAPEYPFSLVTSDTHAYWIPLWLGQIRRKPLVGGPVETFATGQNGLNAITIDGAWVYWAAEQSTQIRRAPAIGSGVPTTLVTLTRGIGQLQVKNGFVYWLPSGDAAVYRRAVAGGATEVVASNPATVLNFDTDGTRVYWFRDGPLLQSAPLGVQSVVLLTPRAAGGIVVEGNDFYFGGDTLRRLPK